jgi:hypothetical protein
MNLKWNFCVMAMYLMKYKSYHCADDMILFSESTKGLQDMLDTLLLYTWTCQWSLTVNIAKTKIMVFRNGGFVREEEKWYYGGNVIDMNFVPLVYS